MNNHFFGIPGRWLSRDPGNGTRRWRYRTDEEVLARCASPVRICLSAKKGRMRLETRNKSGKPEPGRGLFSQTVLVLFNQGTRSLCSLNPDFFHPPSCSLPERNSVSRRSGTCHNSPGRWPAVCRRYHRPTSGLRCCQAPPCEDAGRGHRQGKSRQPPGDPVLGNTVPGGVCTDGQGRWEASGSTHRSDCRSRFGGRLGWFRHCPHRPAFAGAMFSSSSKKWCFFKKSFTASMPFSR